MKVKHTRTGFGTRGNAKAAANIKARAGRMREETGLRARLKEFLLGKRAKEDRRKLGKDEVRKHIAVPNRKQLRRGLARGKGKRCE